MPGPMWTWQPSPEWQDPQSPIDNCGSTGLLPPFRYKLGWNEKSLEHWLAGTLGKSVRVFPWEMDTSLRGLSRDPPVRASAVVGAKRIQNEWSSDRSL